MVDTRRVTDKVMNLLNAEAPVGGRSVRLSASIGISLYPDDSEDAAALMQMADAAMYVAKTHGPGCCVLHGEASPDEPRQYPPGRATPGRLEPGALVPKADAEGLHSDLREAHERLLRAAKDAKASQAAADVANRRRTELLAVVAHELSDRMAPIRAAAAELDGVQTEALRIAPGLNERQIALMSRRIADLPEASRGHEAR